MEVFHRSQEVYLVAVLFATKESAVLLTPRRLLILVGLFLLLRPEVRRPSSIGLRQTIGGFSEGCYHRF